MRVVQHGVNAVIKSEAIYHPHSSDSLISAYSFDFEKQEHDAPLLIFKCTGLHASIQRRVSQCKR